MDEYYQNVGTNHELVILQLLTFLHVSAILENALHHGVCKMGNIFVMTKYNNVAWRCQWRHTHTHTHTYIYIYIYISGKAGFCVLNYCVVLVYVQIIEYILAIRSYKAICTLHYHHYHHYADLSEGIELLKCLSDIFCLERVTKIRSVLSVIFHAISGAVCIQLTHCSYDDCENTCSWSN